MEDLDYSWLYPRKRLHIKSNILAAPTGRQNWRHLQSAANAAKCAVHIMSAQIATIIPVVPPVAKTECLAFNGLFVLQQCVDLAELSRIGSHL